eukprot:scaffold423118_cov52-Prasinocladus_malaysianus.AAC.1
MEQMGRLAGSPSTKRVQAMQIDASINSGPDSSGQSSPFDSPHTPSGLNLLRNAPRYLVLHAGLLSGSLMYT